MDSDSERKTTIAKRDESARRQVAPIGETPAASIPLSPTPDDISLYDEGEWEGTEETSRAEVISSVGTQFREIIAEIENIGDGASEESASLGKKKSFFKLSLIVLTGAIALINFAASAFPMWARLLALISGVIAISAATIGSIDGYFSFSEKVISMTELHYRCRNVVTNLRARWAAGVLNKPDFKTYRNAVRALDAAQKELQQINRLAKGIADDRESKPGAAKNSVLD